MSGAPTDAGLRRKATGADDGGPGAVGAGKTQSGTKGEVTMNTRRWIEFATALLLGTLIGYLVAPSARYTFAVGRVIENEDVLYRCDTHTGKTWWFAVPKQASDPWGEAEHGKQDWFETDNINKNSNTDWREIPETDHSLPVSYSAAAEIHRTEAGKKQNSDGTLSQKQKK